MKRGTLFFTLLTALPLLSFLAPPKDACIDEVRSMYKKFNDITALRNAGSKVYFLDYSVKSVTKDSLKDGIKASFIRMWMDSKKMEVQSDDMQVYQDEKNAFVVIPSRKMILRNDPDRRENKAKSGLISKAQDTLFALSKVLSCGMIGNTSFKQVVLEVNESGRQLLKISKMSFVIDTRSHEFKNMRLDFAGGENQDGNRIMYVCYDFKTLSMDCKDKILSTDFAPRFLASEKELNPKYKGYTLVDNRLSANKNADKVYGK
jgi:hypothetical protein